MEWRALEEHFCKAGRRDPGPFGDDAFEWDHSRYARALGLTGEPGAHDLPHRACVVAALPRSRWDAAERRLQGLAGPRGWAVWRVSARPTVAAPDAVTCALGARAFGAEAFALRRAARPIRPRERRLPNEALPFPLTTGERWLIATERVRRRMRAEIGMRGLVLFVEEAEWLTPAGLALLMHLLDAERAWRARMLARPARVYVVLAVSPGREEGIVQLLERFGLNGHPPVLRERRKPAADVAPPILRDAEEEYLLGALAAAPVGLSEEDVSAIFGASAVDRCRDMAERGLLRSRAEAGQVCYTATHEVTATAPARALLALAAAYRRRARGGHEHLGLAAAAVDLMLGKALRPVAAVARMCHTAGALLPHRVFEMLDAALERMRPSLKADHVAAWFSLAAHNRAYDHARELAGAATARPLRTWKELYRVVRVVLCTGRTHLDTCLPEDFWPRLKSQRIAGPFMDVSCVLAELFWRKRYFSNDEVRQRFEFACECFERGESEKPQSSWFKRLERVDRLVIYRAALHLEVPTSILRTSEHPSARLREFLRTGQMPAFLGAAPAFVEAGYREIPVPRSFHNSDRCFATALGATTGHPGDLVITTCTEGGRLSRRGLRVLLRDVFDDVLLAVRYRALAWDRHEVARALLYVVGGRCWLVGTTAVFMRYGRGDVPGREPFDEMAVGEALMQAGDLAGARDQIVACLARLPRCPLLLATQIVAYITLARKSLDRPLLASADGLIGRHRAALGPHLVRHLRAMLQGSEALCGADFETARRCFLAAYEALPSTAERMVELRKTAMTSWACASRALRAVSAWSVGSSRPSIWKIMRALCVGPGWLTAPPSFRARAAICLDHICGVLDAWATTSRADDEILRVMHFLKSGVDGAFRPLGHGFLELMATWSPRYYERLRVAVIAGVGNIGAGVPEARALAAAIRTLEGSWNGSVPAGEYAHLRIKAGRSQFRQARRAALTWHDDATTYAQLWRADGEIRTCSGGERQVVAYGHVGPTASRAVATTLTFKIRSLDEGCFDIHVETSAGRPASASVRTRRLTSGAEAEVPFIGRSEAARKVQVLIETAARCSYPALVLGETGVGKDLVARCIHAASDRHKGLLVAAECAGVVDSLLESELFGHEKGAFTGAHAVHQGVFERANGSTLLLDDADSMPRRMQAAVLRVLESGEYRRVGSSFTRRSAFRVITAALPRLLDMVANGEFRQDLFYRISTLRIEIPPLCEREGDAEEIAATHARSLGLRLTAGARRAIAGYNWPGNVRQLQHCIQAAGLHAVDMRIGEAAMNDVIGTYRSSGAAGRDGREDPHEAWARALRTLERMKRFGAWDFAKAAELSRRSAQRHIARLLREGRIVRIGAGRATRYGVRS